MNIYTSAAGSPSLLEKDPAFRVITVTKETGLGLKILGGINRNEGPLVYIQEVIPGGDCYKDGRLKPGDQLVSVNKESMIGVSFEEAKNIITRAKLRSECPWEIAFIRQKSYSGHPGNICCPSPLQASEDCEPQTSAFNPFPPPPETLVPKTSSTPKTQDSVLPSFKAAQTKPRYSKTEHTPITSLENSPTDTSNSDFVQVARNLFCLQLDEVNVGVHEISSILDSQLLPCDALEADEMGKLKQERDAARAEANVLKEKLLESEKHRKQLTEELQNVKQEAKAVAEETRALRSRIHLAEAAQRQAHGMEMDYEEVVRLLEAEISELKAQLAHYSDQNKESIQDLRKRVTVLDCQLRKSEMARKTFKASTESLLRFVEAAQEVLLDSSAPFSSLSERRAVFASQTSLPLLGKNGRSFPANLLLESKELVRSVRAVLDMDSSFNLDPFGKEVDESSSEYKAFNITAFELECDHRGELRRSVFISTLSCSCLSVTKTIFGLLYCV
ncbi:syntaxin-binding protein 4 isoform X5 [Mesocricetus auratus]|uniref:Syntaxin-binding protein 4 isoform X5 n=1 Tax=Mesocricetus auratus TaxID=10036 RepID=A0ABM2XT84_MESAU|nr:syntaxin-binding protein 4 isoform X5 [Mesocricetus auratus]